MTRRWWREGAESTQGSASARVCREEAAVRTRWPQPARGASVAEAEGDKDAICHITCSEPVSSGGVAGVSSAPL